MTRRFDPSELELMDRPQPVSAELENDLANLRQLNRFFGSYALVSKFLRRWIKIGDHLRMVDLATGSGDIPRLIVDHARRIGAQVSIDAIDGQAATLEIARRLSATYPEINFHSGDIRTWESGERYDIVLCSLVLHHFSEDDAVIVLRHARELSRARVLLADLRRGFLASAGVWLLTATLFRDPMTKFDGRMSAARAFSFSELRALAERAGWRDFGHAKFKFARQAIWSEEAMTR
jgi:2-polyprenyl-3-methyl-5-hydroxy-6-metoxy-1,4-benzoquinol methylase